MMKLMGIDAEGTPVVIDIKMCPARITEAYTAMLALPGTPLIHSNSIVYYDEENDIAEGDILFSNGVKEGLLYFSQGWKVHKPGFPGKAAAAFPHISVVKGARSLEVNYQIRKIEARRPAAVCYGKEEYYLEQMYIYKNGMIGLTTKPNLIYADELLLSSGYVYNQRVLGFGSFVESGFVEVNSRLELIISMNGKTIKVFNQTEKGE